jgi:hypothetical protein
MEGAMQDALTIALAPERLEDGTPEERATFGLFTIAASAFYLTQGFDHYISATRNGPLVSGYHAAEWFAWNWWRLVAEGRSFAPDWAFAHDMTTIGEGYVWPNVRIFSDGYRTALISVPSLLPDAKPFRYIGAPAVVIPTTAFIDALDLFIGAVVARVSEMGSGSTNLARAWTELLAERSHPSDAKRRRLEALLGCEPDAPPDAEIEGLMRDANVLGDAAVEEIAADHAQVRDHTPPATAEHLRALARVHGVARDFADSLDTVALSDATDRSTLPAWRLGYDAARRVRENLGIADRPLPSEKLSEIAGIPVTAIERHAPSGPRFAFALDEGSASRVVLRSNFVTGRRFEIARLLGDRLFAVGETLRPLTRSGTYRQKAQRAFAAELLCPYLAVEERARGDYSDESIEDIAEAFDVSTQTVATILVNHGRLPREIETASSDFDEGLAAS